MTSELDHVARDRGSLTTARGSLAGSPNMALSGPDATRQNAATALGPGSRPADPVCAALLDLAENELRHGRVEASAAVARPARGRSPDEPGPQCLLANAGSRAHANELPDDRWAGVHFASAKAYRLLGDTAAADREYRAALAWDANLSEAHDGLARLRLPGEDYLGWLARLHAVLTPKTYLEIGVHRGRSLACARPPTHAIGIDPCPTIDQQFAAETQIFFETSDEFFARHGLDAPFDGEPLDFAFIDGLHLFEQTLKDFISVEVHCRRNAIVILHDTIPLDEITQRRTKATTFYTGDVWKIVPCLRYYRPDLKVFTIATAPTGLTVVTGLDPASQVLAERYDEAVKRFVDLPFSDLAENREAFLNMVPNDWAAVQARLEGS